MLRSQKPNDPNPEWEAVAAAVTRAQARGRGNPKPLKVREVTSKMALDKEELVRLQEEKSPLQKFKEMKRTETRKEYRIQDFVRKTWRNLVMGTSEKR